MKIQTGRCTCDKVRYEITGEPLFTHACHCTLCQRRSGSAFGLSMMVLSDQFSITQGGLVSVEVAADSGNKKFNYFCGGCGTVIYGDSPAQPGIINVRPGTLDDTSWFTVGAHIWIKSKQPWVGLPGDIPCFETIYDRDEVWPESSLHRLD